jgi:hypothetical protein
MRISADGKVGIGTIAPAYALDVVGETRGVSASVTNSSTRNEVVTALAGTATANGSIEGQHAIGVSGWSYSDNTRSDARAAGIRGESSGSAFYPMGVYGTATTNSADAVSTSFGVYGRADTTGQGWAYAVCGATTAPYGEAGATHKYAGAFFGNVYVDNDVWVHGDLTVNGQINAVGLPNMKHGFVRQNGSNPLAVTFPAAFPDGSNVHVVISRNYSGQDEEMPAVLSVSNTGFSIRGDAVTWVNNSWDNGRGMGFYWIAVSD